MPPSEIVTVLELIEQGKSAEAIDEAARLVEQMPAHVTSHVAHAMALESQERYRDALRSWQKARQILPNSPLIRKGLQRVGGKLVRTADGELQFADWTADETNLRVDQHSFLSQTPTVEQDLLTDPLVTDAPAEPEPGAPEDAVGDFEQTEGPETRHEIDPDLPGFERVGSMFDIEPEFEQQLAEQVESDHEALPGLESRPPSPKAGEVVGEAPTSDDLDRLISDLETAKIVPKDEPSPAPSLESNTEGMVSETLAQIFATQKQYGEAARIYEKLAYLNPEREREFLDKAAEMKERTND